MRNELLVIHCSATPEGVYFDKDDIIKWHTSPVNKGGRGWSKAGYNDIVLLDGTLQSVIPFDTNNIVDPWEVANGAKGFNDRAVHICYIGGLDTSGKKKDTRTLHQLNTLTIYVRYMILRNPEIKIAGHNQLAEKDCPSFDVSDWCRKIGVQEKNIYNP